MSGIHHLGLTVNSAESSARWYKSVLGFERVSEYTSPDGERRKVFLHHGELDVRLGLTEHRSGSHEPFAETATGLDHLAFRVDAETDLRDWQDRFIVQGVVFSPVAPANSIPGAVVLVFRDPDNIQLELFFDPTQA